MSRLSLPIAACVALLAAFGSGASGSATVPKEPIVIGTANSLTGVLAPFELAINNGMAIAADEINAAGGVARPQDQDHPRRCEIRPQPVGDRCPGGDREGRADRRAVCDADLGAPGARAANGKGVLAITCAGAPGIGRQSVGPLTFNTYTGSPTESAIDAEYAYNTLGWRRAYFLCDRVLEYTKVVCEAFKARWKSLGGKVVGEDTFLQSDVSIASQVTRLVNGSKPDFVLLGSFPGGSPAIKEIRARYAGPIMLSAAYSGTFWLKATPHLSNAWVAAVGSSYGDDPRAEVNAFFRKYKSVTGKAAVFDSYPMLGYSLVQTIAKGVAIAGTTDGEQLAKALETFRGVHLLAGPTTLHADLPRPGQALTPDDPLRQRQAEVDRRLVHPQKVPPTPADRSRLPRRRDPHARRRVPARPASRRRACGRCCAGATRRSSG